MPNSHVKIGGDWKAVNVLHVKVSSAWKVVKNAYVKVGGAWKLAYSSLAATADKATVSGSGSGASPCGNPGDTDAVTVTAVGGTSPYSYAWSRVGAAASSGPYQANSPTSNVTTFSDADSSVCDADAESSETWRCTVTDDNSQTATVDVTVTLTWTNTS